MILNVDCLSIYSSFYFGRSFNVFCGGECKLTCPFDQRGEIVGIGLISFSLHLNSLSLSRPAATNLAKRSPDSPPTPSPLPKTSPHPPDPSATTTDVHAVRTPATEEHRYRASTQNSIPPHFPRNKETRPQKVGWMFLETFSTECS